MNEKGRNSLPAYRDIRFCYPSKEGFDWGFFYPSSLILQPRLSAARTHGTSFFRLHLHRKYRPKPGRPDKSPRSFPWVRPCAGQM